MSSDANGTTPGATLLGRYRIEGILGEGGLGTVVRAFDTRLKRTVAIKTLKRTDYAGDPSLFRTLEERFAREAEAGSRMGSHPNLVTVYDLVAAADGTQYLIQEYVPGGMLADRIRQGRLPVADALRLAADIARGLQSAHNVGIVHRDIKPANVFLGEEDRAQVGDFGIAQIDDLSGRTRATVGHPGTPLYMSPEQAHSTGYVRPSSDQYSLGLVLFEMLTGASYKRVGPRQAAQLLTEQPLAVQELLARMLADDPDDRYPTTAELIRGIQSVQRRLATAETQIAPGISTDAPTVPHQNDDALVTRRDTPRIGLQPVPAVTAPFVPPPTMPIAPRYSRRVILIGAGGLIVAAGSAGAAMVGLHTMGSAVATPTVSSTAVAAKATNVPPTALAVGASTIAVTAPIPTPIVITAPPVVITATPSPTATTAPTPIVITAPPIVITATPNPTAIPTAASAFSGADERDAASNVVQTYFNAINRRDFRTAYAQYGVRLQQQQGYAAFAAVFDTAERDDLQIDSVTNIGSRRYAVAVRFTSLQTNGSSQRYAGTYTVGVENNALKILDTSLGPA